MRNVVKTLWHNATDPLNDDRDIDMVSFIALVLNGQITNEEMQEILEVQG